MNQFEEKDIVKIATLYFEEGLTQAEIARKIGVSRSLVSKMLLDAREEGIVEIFINSKNAYTVSLERALEKKYGLIDAVIIDTKNLTKEDIEKLASQEAARYLRKASKEMTHIGLSWGKSIRGMVDYYPYTNQSEVSVISLIGGMGDDHVDIHSNQLCYDLARKMRGKPKYLYAPALLANEALKKELVNNKAIHTVLEEGRKVELAVVGISSPYEASTMESIGYINKADIEELKKSGIVGDINSRFFNEEGIEADCTINRNVIGLNLSDLREINKVMAIAYNNSKIDAIKVSLESKLVNIIVTTDVIADALLEK